MNKALAERLFLAGKDMRQAQKRCAKNRNLENNRNRIDTERKFDEVLAECTKGAPQAKLF